MIDEAKQDEVNEDINENDEDVNEKDEVFNDTVDGDNMMLSTIDNPFNPKTDYDMWKRWDNDNGYDTEEYIARLINMEETYDVDDEFTLNILTTKVINEILENDDRQIYRLI